MTSRAPPRASARNRPDAAPRTALDVTVCDALLLSEKLLPESVYAAVLRGARAGSAKLLREHLSSEPSQCSAAARAGWPDGVLLVNQLLVVGKADAWVAAIASAVADGSWWRLCPTLYQQLPGGKCCSGMLALESVAALSAAARVHARSVRLAPGADGDGPSSRLQRIPLADLQRHLKSTAVRWQLEFVQRGATLVQGRYLHGHGPSLCMLYRCFRYESGERREGGAPATRALREHLQGCACTWWLRVYISLCPAATHALVDVSGAGHTGHSPDLPEPAVDFSGSAADVTALLSAMAVERVPRDSKWFSLHPAIVLLLECAVAQRASVQGGAAGLCEHIGEYALQYQAHYLSAYDVGGAGSTARPTVVPALGLLSSPPQPAPRTRALPMQPLSRAGANVAAALLDEAGAAALLDEAGAAAVGVGRGGAAAAPSAGGGDASDDDERQGLELMAEAATQRRAAARSPGSGGGRLSAAADCGDSDGSDDADGGGGSGAWTAAGFRGTRTYVEFECGRRACVHPAAASGAAAAVAAAAVAAAAADGETTLHRFSLRTAISSNGAIAAHVADARALVAALGIRLDYVYGRWRWIVRPSDVSNAYQRVLRCSMGAAPGHSMWDVYTAVTMPRYIAAGWVLQLLLSAERRAYREHFEAHKLPPADQHHAVGERASGAAGGRGAAAAAAANVSSADAAGAAAAGRGSAGHGGAHGDTQGSAQGGDSSAGGEGSVRGPEPSTLSSVIHGVGPAVGTALLALATAQHQAAALPTPVCFVGNYASYSWLFCSLGAAAVGVCDQMYSYNAGHRSWLLFSRWLAASDGAAEDNWDATLGGLRGHFAAQQPPITSTTLFGGDGRYRYIDSKVQVACMHVPAVAADIARFAERFCKRL